MVDSGSADGLILAHLTASPFLGGPERQMIGLARAMPESTRTVFWSFAEGGKARPFLDEAARHGFEAVALERNAPAYRAAVDEIADRLRALKPDVLFCHGYKADLLGGFAARRTGTPVVAVSRGWTGATLKVRCNEWLDRLALLAMDRVVCVSEGQAVKVRRAGVPDRRVQVIRNAIRLDRFDAPRPDGRRILSELFPKPPDKIVGAAGRLSPEKGFGDLVEAASILARTDRDTGFVIFGEGPFRATVQGAIDARRLSDRFVLAPFRDDLDALLPHLDVLAMPSYTEGLPNVALEASACRVPVVGTDVGGIPEVVDHGETGYVVPPADPCSLAARIAELLDDPELRARMGEAGRRRVERLFSFAPQADAYVALVERLREPRPVRPSDAPTVPSSRLEAAPSV